MAFKLDRERGIFMGRPFTQELEKLSSTYEYAYNYDEFSISKISDFLLSTYDKSLFLVGSGGSFSVAKAFEYFHSCAGLPGVAKAVTPLELTAYSSAIANSSVVLLTANGNNNDTINAYKFIKYSNPISFMVLCLNEKSKIKKLTNEDSTVFVGQRLPAGKDGYLAVNSIIAIIVWLVRAYEKIVKINDFVLPLDFCLFNEQDFLESSNALSKESIIVLHSGFSTPVAVDIESKFSEVALGNILLADYRNFAHGRHFWLSQRTQETAIIPLVTPENKTLVSKTLDLVPEELTVFKLETLHLGSLGMLDLFKNAFYLTQYAGKIKGIDPGKPKVPDFGRKMYHISYTPAVAQQAKKNGNLENRAAFRKCSSNFYLFDCYKSAFKNFKANVKNVMFELIIFDYDATLKEKYPYASIENEIFYRINLMLKSGIIVKIATGRGKSVRKEMQEKIHEEYWDNVIIGYYNGGIIAPLSDNTAPSLDISACKSLEKLASQIKELLPNINVDLRPCQLTIILDDYQKSMCKEFFIEFSRKHTDVKAYVSGHSIDIIPIGTSKKNLIPSENSKCLCIGDSGQYQGNDYELLSYKYSLSVNRVSSGLESCWNYAPLGLNHTKATLYYLNNIEINEGYFTLNIL